MSQLHGRRSTTWPHWRTQPAVRPSVRPALYPLGIGGRRLAQRICRPTGICDSRRRRWPVVWILKPIGRRECKLYMAEQARMFSAASSCPVNLSGIRHRIYLLTAWPPAPRRSKNSTCILTRFSMLQCSQEQGESFFWYNEGSKLYTEFGVPSSKIQKAVVSTYFCMSIVSRMMGWSKTSYLLSMEFEENWEQLLTRQIFYNFFSF